MAASAQITNTFLLTNNTDGTRIDITQYFLRAIEVNIPSFEVLNYLKPVLATDNDDLNKGKVITILRQVRNTAAAKMLSFENGNSATNTFLPVARFKKISVGEKIKAKIMADVVVLDNFDAARVGDLNAVGMEYANFINSHIMQVLETFYSDLENDANSYKLYTHSTSTSDATRTNQPSADSTKKTATTLAKIKAGRRVNITTDCFTGENGIDLLDEMMRYLLYIGVKNNSIEKSYPFAWTGYKKSDLIILATEKFRNKLRGTNITKFVDANKRVGLVNGLDSYENIDIFVDKNLPENVECILMVRGTYCYLEPNAVIQNAGVVSMGGTAIVPTTGGNSKAVELFNHQGKITFTKFSYQKVLQNGLAFYIKSA